MQNLSLYPNSPQLSVQPSFAGWLGDTTEALASGGSRGSMETRGRAMAGSRTQPVERLFSQYPMLLELMRNARVWYTLPTVHLSPVQLRCSVFTFYQRELPFGVVLAPLNVHCPWAHMDETVGTRQQSVIKCGTTPPNLPHMPDRSG